MLDIPACEAGGLRDRWRRSRTPRVRAGRRRFGARRVDRSGRRPLDSRRRDKGARDLRVERLDQRAGRNGGVSDPGRGLGWCVVVGRPFGEGSWITRPEESAMVVSNAPTLMFAR